MTLLLIDLSQLFWTAHHAGANEELSFAFEQSLAGVRKLIEREKPDHTAICCDFPPYARKKLLPLYKANREAAPPLAIEQLRKVERRLRDDGLTVWSVPGFEADDVIATAAYMATTKEMSVIIASGDKDLLQCIRKDVLVVHPSNDSRWDTQGCIERLGVHPESVADLLALTGDKSDNIPGIAGCGAKTAAKWLQTYGDLQVIFANARELGRFADVVTEKADEIRLWRRVVELDRGVPIRFEELFEEKVVKPLVKNEMPEDDDAEALDSVTDGNGPTQVVIGADVKLPAVTAVAAGNAELTLEMPKPPQAIVQRTAQEQVITLQPRNAREGWWLSGTLVNSRLYTKFSSQEQVYAIIVRGQELGLGAMTALDCIHMVEGKPTMHAHLIVARAKAHPKCEYFRCVSTSGESATYETKHRDDPDKTTLTYTLAEAKAAGLCPMNPRNQPVLKEGNGGKARDIRGNWEKRPAEMVRKTAAVQLTRMVYPDAALGLYSTEEMSDDE